MNGRFETTEALRTTEFTEKNSENSVLSVVLSASVVTKAGSHDLLSNPHPAQRGFGGSRASLSPRRRRGRETAANHLTMSDLLPPLALTRQPT